MDTLPEFGAYLVIKTLKQNDIEKFKCIPKSWVEAKDMYNNNVVFRYPLEERSCNRIRIIKCQPLDKKWPLLYGEVVSHTDSQDEAFQCLEKKLDKLKSGSGQTKETNKQDVNKDVEITIEHTKTIRPIKLASKTTDCEPKRKQPDQENIIQNNTIEKELGNKLDLEILEAHELIRTYASELDNEETALPPTSNVPNNTQIPDTTQIFPNETENSLEETSANNRNATKISDRPRRKSSLRTHNYYLELSDEDFDMSDDMDYDPEMEDPDSDIESSNFLKPQPAQQSVPVGAVAVNNLLAKDINLNLQNDEVYSHCYNFYVEFNKSYQKTMSILDNAADFLHNVIITHKNNAVARETQSSSLLTNQQLMNGNLFSQSQPLLQERLSSRNEDTKWTLRYPESGLETTELMPGSGVYVSERGLHECKSNNNGTTQFTRALLEEVFTDEALRKCSFTGTSRRKIRKNPQGKRKPGLDLRARQTFFLYVLRYSSEMGWKKANPRIIMSCIKNRLQRLHRIGQKTSSA